MRKHIVDLFVAEDDLVYRLPAVLEGDVVAVHIGWQEDLWVPRKALA